MPCLVLTTLESDRRHGAIGLETYPELRFFIIAAFCFLLTYIAAIAAEVRLLLVVEDDSTAHGNKMKKLLTSK